MGLDTLAAASGEDALTIEDVYEPFLLQLGFIQRTPRGRLATPAAYLHLGRQPAQQALDPQINFLNEDQCLRLPPARGADRAGAACGA